MKCVVVVHVKAAWTCDVWVYQRLLVESHMAPRNFRHEGEEPLRVPHPAPYYALIYVRWLAYVLHELAVRLGFS